MKQIFILRSASGAGKTSFANLIQSIYPAAVIVCADDYMYEDGFYKWTAGKLEAAHNACKDKFAKAVDNCEKLIIVANTNSSKWEWSYYENYGQSSGYSVTFLIIENRHGNENIHGVSPSVIIRQSKNIINSIKLF